MLKKRPDDRAGRCDARDGRTGAAVRTADAPPRAGEPYKLFVLKGALAATRRFLTERTSSPNKIMQIAYPTLVATAGVSHPIVGIVEALGNLLLANRANLAHLAGTPGRKPQKHSAGKAPITLTLYARRLRKADRQGASKFLVSGYWN